MSLVICDHRWNAGFCEWLTERFDHPEWYFDPKDFRTIAHVQPEEGKPAQKKDILCVVGLSMWTPHTVEITVATAQRRCRASRRELIWTVFDYIFNHAKKTRLVSYVAVDNQPALNINKLFGLTQVALITDHYGEGKDAYLFGLTKRDWLAGPWSKDPSS